MPRREGWIDWRSCEAREVLLQDLSDGTLPLDEETMSTQEAWEYYSQTFEFRNVVFSQFEEQLAEHREQIDLKATHIDKQMKALVRDRELHPKKTHNQRGERVFYLSPAYPLLVQDVEDKKHISMTKVQLFHSRTEYCTEWKWEIFERRLRQEVMRQKFVHDCNMKRDKKEEAKAKKKQIQKQQAEHAYQKAVRDLQKQNAQGNQS